MQQAINLTQSCTAHLNSRVFVHSQGSSGGRSAATDSVQLQMLWLIHLSFQERFRMFFPKLSRLFKSGRRRRSFTTVTGFDALETRQLLAGTATVAISPSYDITVTGDSRGNDVSVEVTADGDVLVVGNDTSLKFSGFGQSRTVAAGTQVALSDLLDAAGLDLPASLQVRSIGADMGRGDDTLTLTVNKAVTIARDANFRMGTGSDTLTITANKSISIGGSLSVTGTGTDKHNATVVITAAAPANGGGITVAKNFTVSTGSGHDTVLLGSVANLQQALDDPAAIANKSDKPAEFAIRVGGNFSVTASLGNDFVAASSVGVGGNASISMGDGGRRNDVLFLDNVGVIGNLTMTGMENGFFQNLSVGRNLSLTSSSTGDALVADRIQVGGNATMNLGGGSDRVALGDDVTVGGRVTVSGGAGRDYVSIATPPTGARISGVESAELDIDLLEAMFAYLAESGLSESIGALIPVVEAPPADADLIELLGGNPMPASASRPLVFAPVYTNAAGPGARLGLFISEDAEITADDLLVASAPLADKAIRPTTVQFSVNRSSIPQSFIDSAEGYYVGFLADYDQITSDGDRTNNGNRLGRDLFYYVGTTLKTPSLPPA
jgi:hypothetical protein